MLVDTVEINRNTYLESGSGGFHQNTEKKNLQELKFCQLKSTEIRFTEKRFGAAAGTAAAWETDRSLLNCTENCTQKTVALTKGWGMSGISILWSNDEADKDECDELYDEAMQLEREGKLFQVAGGRSKDAAVGGLLEQQVVQPPQNRKRNDADTEEDVEYPADGEEEEENDPAWADMMAEMAEEDEDVVENDSNDENQLPIDLASCFKPCTTRSGRTTRPPVRS